MLYILQSFLVVLILIQIQLLIQIRMKLRQCSDQDPASFSRTNDPDPHPAFSSRTNHPDPELVSSNGPDSDLDFSRKNYPNIPASRTNHPNPALVSACRTNGPDPDLDFRQKIYPNIPASRQIIWNWIYNTSCCEFCYSFYSSPPTVVCSHQFLATRQKK